MDENKLAVSLAALLLILFIAVLTYKGSDLLGYANYLVSEHETYTVDLNTADSISAEDSSSISAEDSSSISAKDSSSISAEDRTADLPDSWLVVYNSNNSDSVEWKNWYIQQWGIPEENTLGLNVSTDERVQQQYFKDFIWNPIVNHLAKNQEIERRIMGILVGYKVPGNFYLDSNNPKMQGGGGWSVSSHLMNLTAKPEVHMVKNARYFRNNLIEYYLKEDIRFKRFTKATLGDGQYMTARIDAPTLDQAKNLTLRAKAISNPDRLLGVNEKIYYDYTDEKRLGPAYNWLALRKVTDPLIQEPYHFYSYLWDSQIEHPIWPIFEYVSEEEATPGCALQFHYYKLTGWQYVEWYNELGGSRILGYALNSYGATTLRNTMAHSGRYVPNALFKGGFASALGATAEPALNREAEPGPMIFFLSKGWTISEVFYHCVPHSHFMWELVGDPLMRVPHWFTPRPIEVISSLEHDNRGYYSVDLMRSDQSIKTEGRNGIANKSVLVSFDRQIQGVGGLDTNDISVVGEGDIIIDRIYILGNKLLVTMSGIPDNSKITINFPGIEDLNGNLVPEIEQLEIKYLVGDINGDEKVDIFDMVELRDHLNRDLTTENSRCDINSDGSINAMDLVAVRNHITE